MRETRQVLQKFTNFVGGTMARARTIEEVVKTYVRNSLEAFCEGKQNLNWIRAVIRKSGVLSHDGVLLEIFCELARYKGNVRYQEIFEECQGLQWISG